MVQDRSGMFGGGRGLGTQDVRAEAPRAHLVTRDEALAALDGMSGSARQVVAHLLSQAWAEGISFGPTVTLPVSTLEALGVVVARRRFEGPRRDWVLEHPQALVEDISELAQLGFYLPAGWVRLAASDYLAAVLLAILTGEPQPFAPDDAANVGNGVRDDE